MASVVEGDQPHENRRATFLLGYLARIGTVYRTMFETWLHAAYLATGGERALDELEAQLAFEWARMDRAFGVDATKRGGTRLTVQDPATRLDGVFSRIEPEFGGWPQEAYKNHYRVTSFHDAQGHLACLATYIDQATGHVSSARNPDTAHHVFAVAISLAIGVTNVAATELGIDVAEDLRAIQDVAGPVYEQVTSRSGAG